MSFQNLLVKVFLRLSNYKKRREKLSFEEKQAENVPDAPPRIAGEFACETVSVEGAEGVWLARENSGNGVLVYLHGGSYVSGPFAQQWEYLAAMCRLTKMAALLIDYRLAPQNPFPGGLDDCLMLLETLSAIGDLPEKWFLLGDSAGAGLAVAVFYELRDAGISLPQKMILMSGWYDLTVANPEIQKNQNIDPMLSYENIVKSAAAYVGNEDAKNPLISPLFGDAGNLPPTLLQCGTADLLIFENRAFYQKCLQAGARVKYEEYDGLFHDFMMVALLPEARAARKSQVEFLLS
ncbi:MAG TPA: alpha/beta hydrolase [Pyrinomonadaceae bacterium]|jgi:acetyl esterase/lipase